MALQRSPVVGLSKHKGWRVKSDETRYDVLGKSMAKAGIPETTLILQD